MIALTIPATIAATAPSEPTTIESAAFTRVVVRSAPAAAPVAAEAPAAISRPAFVPSIPAGDLRATAVRSTPMIAEAAERARPTPSTAHAVPKIVPPKPKPKPKPAPKAHGTSSAASHGSSKASGARARIVNIALAQIGDRYVSGGTGPNSFDCSGLVRYAYASAGVSGKLGGGHSASAMLAWGRANGLTSRSGGRPGDVAIYGNGSHAAIYLGNGTDRQRAQPEPGDPDHRPQRPRRELHDVHPHADLTLGAQAARS